MEAHNHQSSYSSSRSLYAENDDDDDDADDDWCRRQVDSMQLSDEALPPVTERRPKRRHGRRSSEYRLFCYAPGEYHGIKPCCYPSVRLPFWPVCLFYASSSTVVQFMAMATIRVNTSVREYVFYVLFRLKKLEFLRFFEMTYQKVVSKSLVLNPSERVYILRSSIIFVECL